MSGKHEALYIHFEDILNPNKAGIINKIEGQKEAFGKLNYRLHIVSFRTKHKLYLDDDCILTLPSRILFFRFFIFRKLSRIISERSFAFIYIRYFGSDVHFIHFLRRITRDQIKIFLEFPTFPYDQERRPENFLERYAFSLDRHYRNELHKYVYKAITFTDKADILKMPTLKLENGISLAAIHLTPHSQEKSSLHLIGVANVSAWHGYDRILRGLYEYYRSENHYKLVIFTLVGNGNSLEGLKTLCNNLGMSDYIRFVGSKSGKALDEEFNKAHLAIGSLAMHRIGLRTGSVLKLREYIARGFPAVIGYDDLSISKSIPFVYKIPAEDSPVNIMQLVQFYENFEVSQDAIRAYAAEHFSWEKSVGQIIATL